MICRPCNKILSTESGFAKHKQTKSHKFRIRHCDFGIDGAETFVAESKLVPGEEGLFAKENIIKGTLINWYVGINFGSRLAIDERIRSHNKDSCYVMDVGTDFDSSDDECEDDNNNSKSDDDDNDDSEDDDNADDGDDDKNDNKRNKSKDNKKRKFDDRFNKRKNKNAKNDKKNKKYLERNAKDAKDSKYVEQRSKNDKDKKNSKYKEDEQIVYYIDGWITDDEKRLGKKRSPATYINHSKNNPNVEFHFFRRKNAFRGACIGIIALRNIKVGEELLVYYGDDYHQSLVKDGILKT